MKNVGDAVHVTSLRLGLQEIWLHFFSAPAIDCASVQGTTHQFDVSELEQVKSLMIMIFPWFEATDSCKQCFTFGGVAKEFPLWGKGCGDSPSKLQVSSSVSCSAL